jgi:hypothetical protein
VSILADPLNFNTFTDGPARKKQSPRWLYMQSKLVRNLIPCCIEFRLLTQVYLTRCERRGIPWSHRSSHSSMANRAS